LLRDNQSSMRFDAQIAWPAQCVARYVPFSSVKYSLRKDHLEIEKFFNFPGSVSISLILLDVSDRKSLKPILLCRVPVKFSSHWRKIYQGASVYNQKSLAARDQWCLAREGQLIPFRRPAGSHIFITYSTQRRTKAYRASQSRDFREGSRDFVNPWHFFECAIQRGRKVMWMSLVLPLINYRRF
jgi:hypothetical protein